MTQVTSTLQKQYNKRANNDSDVDRPCKIRRTSSSSVTNLPCDCLSLIFKCLEDSEDRLSFGLTCRQWLHIQNNNQEFLWWWYRRYWSFEQYPEINPDGNFSVLLLKLLNRFQHLKYLSLSMCAKITDFVTLQSQNFGSEVRYPELDYCWEYSDTELSIMFSWFPRLTDLSLKDTRITDRGLYALAKCCSTLTTVVLKGCHLILIQE
ncbi:hypothetical protein MKW94_016987 [Papaver nudicaule]|uniref:F-box domain-containing protein n=1 Tax=Papaver nudicaule TaxID=74823 RepID=A0AA41S1D8_PAPNU|nr:hypothetical protein [Papaver nudicaule]